MLVAQVNDIAATNQLEKVVQLDLNPSKKLKSSLSLYNYNLRIRDNIKINDEIGRR